MTHMVLQVFRYTDKPVTHQSESNDSLFSVSVADIFVINRRYSYDPLRPSHGRRAFSCDKWYVNRKLVAQV